MKTKIRIQQSESTAIGAKYKLMYIQILQKKYKDSNTMESVGAITFQANMGEPVQWYGMRFVFDTDSVAHIKTMAKIAQLIKDKRSDWNAQPDEIIKLIGGQEYVLFHSEFIPVTDKGKKLFDITQNGRLYKRIVAKDEAHAKRILKGQKIPNAVLGFSSEIQF